MQKKLLYKIDSIGFLLSLICAIHCLIFPILLIVLPLIGLNFLLNQTAEKVFVLGSVLVAGFSLFWGYRYHKNTKGLKFYFVGAFLLLMATFVMGHSHEHADDHNHQHEIAIESANSQNIDLKNRPQGNKWSLLFLITGGVCIALSHYYNKRLCKSCPTHRALSKMSEGEAENLSV